MIMTVYVCYCCNNWIIWSLISFNIWLIMSGIMFGEILRAFLMLKLSLFCNFSQALKQNAWMVKLFWYFWFHVDLQLIQTWITKINCKKIIFNVRFRISLWNLMDTSSISGPWLQGWVVKWMKYMKLCWPPALAYWILWWPPAYLDLDYKDELWNEWDIWSYAGLHH